MDNQTGNDTSSLEEEVRKTVEAGQDVQERVRQITLRIVRDRSFDISSLRQTADAVLRGATAGVQKDMQKSSEQAKAAGERLKQAVSGLDVALAQFAEAAKLAVEEASGRAQRYSSEDLKRARSDLEKLESMFLDALKSTSAATRNAAGDILRDLWSHTRANGSAVGRQMTETLGAIGHQMGATGRAQAGAGLHLAQNTSNMLRQIAAGMLSGLADHIKPQHINPQPIKPGGPERPAESQRQDKGA